MLLCWVSWFMYCYAECRYAECHYAEGHYAECRYTVIISYLVGVLAPSSHCSIFIETPWHQFHQTLAKSEWRKTQSCHQILQSFLVHRKLLLEHGNQQKFSVEVIRWRTSLWRVNSPTFHSPGASWHLLALSMSWHFRWVDKSTKCFVKWLLWSFARKSRAYICWWNWCLAGKAGRENSTNGFNHRYQKSSK